MSDDCTVCEGTGRVAGVLCSACDGTGERRAFRMFPSDQDDGVRVSGLDDEFIERRRVVPADDIFVIALGYTIDKKQKAPEPKPRGGGDDE